MDAINDAVVKLVGNKETRALMKFRKLWKEAYEKAATENKAGNTQTEDIAENTTTAAEDTVRHSFNPLEKNKRFMEAYQRGDYNTCEKIALHKKPNFYHQWVEHLVMDEMSNIRHNLKKDSTSVVVNDYYLWYSCDVDLETNSFIIKDLEWISNGTKRNNKNTYGTNSTDTRSNAEISGGDSGSSSNGGKQTENDRLPFGRPKQNIRRDSREIQGDKGGLNKLTATEGQRFFDDDTRNSRDINSGYFGYSMSNRAAEAYKNGEKPKSKWTKTDILNYVTDYAEENDINFDIANLKKLPVRVIKDLLLTQSSWHHTSEYFNRTDFYSVNENVLDTLTDKDILKANIEGKKEVKEENPKYKGDIEYIEWSGTKNHPKATEKKLENVTIEEKGSFYIVYDKNGEQILRKKIGSNGTRVISNEEKKRRAEAEAEMKRRAEERENNMRNNSSAEALAFYDSLKYPNLSRSNSGHIYAEGRKPSRWEYENGLEKFFKVGENRLFQDNDGTLYLETWDGNKWVKEEQDENIRYSKDIDPDFIKTIKNLPEKGRIETGSLYVGKTPKNLEKYGFDVSKKMMITVAHMRNIMHEKEEGNKNYHGLTDKMVLSAISQMSDPVLILSSLDKGIYENGTLLILTDVLDGDNQPIGIYINPIGRTKYNRIDIDVNCLKTMYARTETNTVVSKAAFENRLLYVNREKSQQLSNKTRVQFPRRIPAVDFDSNIARYKKLVNSLKEKNSNTLNSREIDTYKDKQILVDKREYKLISSQITEILGNVRKYKKIIPEIVIVKSYDYWYTCIVDDDTFDFIVIERNNIPNGTRHISKNTKSVDKSVNLDRTTDRSSNIGSGNRSEQEENVDVFRGKQKRRIRRSDERIYEDKEIKDSITATEGQRFFDEEKRYSRDLDYLAAVERGDMETAQWFNPDKEDIRYSREVERLPKQMKETIKVLGDELKAVSYKRTRTDNRIMTIRINSLLNGKVYNYNKDLTILQSRNNRYYD